jgi:hypothetical protein
VAIPKSAVPAFHFSGHETFPLRQLWLRKAYDEVRMCQPSAPKSIFSDEQSIVRFGVGRNMVTAIRHWSVACGFMCENSDGTRTDIRHDHNVLALTLALGSFITQKMTV